MSFELRRVGATDALFLPEIHQSYPLDTSSMPCMGGEESGAGYAAFLGLLGVVSVSIFCVNTSTTFVANALNQTISC
jgi:hypothetical protein